MAVKVATKAALLSGLVFPGVGHLSLKRYVRAAILMLVSLAAAYVLITATVNEAMSVADRISSGEIALDSQAIAAAIAGASGGRDDSTGHAALIVLGACWIFGIVDAYRLGRRLDDE